MTHAGETLWLGFHGTTLPPPVAALLEKGEVGGIILFARNIEAPRQIAELTQEIAMRAPGPHPLPLGIDQEGGRVLRVREVPWPSARQLSTLPQGQITESARRLGEELATLGFNTDFAPVLDTLTNPKNRVIGDRAFGSTPAQVVRGARAFARGLMAAGLAPCGKHFPGHGHTLHDSHLTLPRSQKRETELKALELVPYRELAGDLPLLMTAHILFEHLDPELPATLSPKVLRLAKECGFSGVLVTDDLEMGALSHLDRGSLGVRFIEAGAHMGLVCSNLDLFIEIKETMERHLVEDPLFAQRLSRAEDAIHRFRRGLLPHPMIFDIAKYMQTRDKNRAFVRNLFKLESSRSSPRSS